MHSHSKTSLPSNLPSSLVGGALLLPIFFQADLERELSTQGTGVAFLLVVFTRFLGLRWDTRISPLVRSLLGGHLLALVLPCVFHHPVSVTLAVLAFLVGEVQNAAQVTEGYPLAERTRLLKLLGLKAQARPRIEGLVTAAAICVALAAFALLLARIWPQGTSVFAAAPFLAIATCLASGVLSGSTGTDAGDEKPTTRTP